MESSMPPLPSKKAVALDLLERTSLFVHLDPRRPGVIVPLVFAKQPQLVLQVGLNMAISIPDLEVGETGISCTLSFNRRPHFCRLPWSAIYALIGQEGGGMVWPEDVPPEVVAQQRSAAKKEAPARKPTLRAIPGAGVSADSADRQGEREEAPPQAQRSPTPIPKSDSGRKQAGLRRVSAVPPRGSQSDAELETELGSTSEPSSPELAARQRSETVGADSSGSEPAGSETVGGQTAAPAKRERPPYLRLVR
jgi:stringent starvation protein B